MKMPLLLSGPTVGILWFLYFVNAALGQPTISSISGITRDGSSITIQGRSFGNKNPAAPIVWADFEEGSINPSSLGQRTDWDVVDRLVVTTSNQLPNSLYSVVGTWCLTECGYPLQSFSFRIDKSQAQGYWTTVYSYWKRYYTFSNRQKYWRIWPTAGITQEWHGAPVGVTNHFTAAADTTGGFAANGMESYEGGVAGVIGGYQGTPITAHTWYTEEFRWQHGGGTGLNLDGSPGRCLQWVTPCGVWDYVKNGVIDQHRENVDNGPNNLAQLRVDNFTDSNRLPPDGSKVYIDDIYIDDTYARVMIGNAPTLAASTQREIQIPSAWSDSSVTITVHQGSFKTLNSGYIYVIDSANNVNSNGYPICSTCTQPPSNFKILQAR